jgi:phosphohistidine phosphatase
MTLKKLTLLRHAKAVPALPGVDDHARPLNGRGRRAAAQVGIETAGARPDLVLCSTAVRTRETWEMLNRAWEALPPVLIEDALYLAEPEALLARLRALPATLDHAWLIGHNPGLHDLAAELAHGVAPVTDFPTAARARLEFDAADWAALGTAAARRVDVFLPARD